MGTNGLNKNIHLARCNADPEVLLPDKPEAVHPIKFASIDVESVRKATFKTRGAGLSGLDAEGWKRLFTSTQFADSTTDLYNTLAKVIKKLPTAENLSSSLEAFLVCRLIPLDKNSWLRPMGDGEVLRQIADKVIVTHAREGIVASVGSLQVCPGHEAGCKSFIHAMGTVYEEQSAEAVLLVDASNAFSSVNRNAFLHNVEKNCYSLSNRLFIIGV